MPTKTILIVDDLPANVGVLVDVLSGAGLRAVVAESGESALEQLTWAKPDLILLDVQMPGLDGFETCRRIKANAATAETPVLFMTALTDVVDKVKGFAAGAVDYIAKPLHPEEVLARVNAHLRLRELQLEAEQRADELDREVQRRILAERELSRAFDRAVIVATPTGAMLFVSDRARVILRKYFPGTDSVRLPVALRDGEVPEALDVRRTPGEIGELIYLKEKAPPPSPAQLAQLGLTPRETEILFWVAQGKTNGEIGTILGAATTTVKKHVENLLPKLGVETRLAAALLAAECFGEK
jgi:DNA-binding response OmpR family regulator/DNA-binding CsgD family transcriptional regulator